MKIRLAFLLVSGSLSLAGCSTQGGSSADLTASPAPTYSVSSAVEAAMNSVTEFCLSPQTATVGQLQSSLQNYVEDAEVNGTDAEVQAACAELATSDKELAAAIKAESKRLADEAKNAALLAKYDRWADDAGGGTLSEMYRAIDALESEIEANAAYELTGVEASVEFVGCSPGEYSNWFSGEASGWWSCGIDFLGGEYARYSIEVREGKWAGSPDGGTEAEPLLKWVDSIPYEVRLLAGG